MSKNKFYYIVAELGDKGFKMEAEDAEAFSLDRTGMIALTNFFIDLLDLNNNKVEDLFKKHRVTVYNKTK